MKKSAAVLLFLCCVQAFFAQTAAADERRVAVLEFRAGTAAIPGLADRIVKVLAARTKLSPIGPAVARQRIETVDSELAKCEGNAQCVAEIGRRLNVDELLLVGVSELGDVIVGLQRIRVASGTVRARVAEALPANETPSDGTLETYLRRLLPPADFRLFGTVQIRTNQRDADVYLDRIHRGKTPMAAFTLPAPNKYTLRLSKPGFQDFVAQVTVPPDGKIEVAARLVRSSKVMWYERWWIWAAVGTVAATTAIVVTTSEDSSSASQPGVLRW